MKVKCLIHSTAGKKGDIKDYSNSRASELIKKGICEEYKKVETEVETEKKDKTKKGKSK